MEKFCLFGKTLSHSFSPLIHTLIYNELGLDNIYLLKEFDKEDLVSYVSRLKCGKYKGVNVTIPYKIDIMEYVDIVDNNAKKIGSINTVVSKKQKLIAYNTDYNGIEKTLDKYVNEDTSVLILGFGGATLPLLVYLENKGVKQIYIASRKKRKDFGIVKFIEYKEIPSIKGDIIINTTPVGMYPNIEKNPLTSFFEKDVLDENLYNEYLDSIYNNFSVAFDLIYNPTETEFLSEARKRGLVYINGLKMLVYQAIYACEKFLDINFDDDFSESIYIKVKEIIYSGKKNISFIGLPGSGKSTVGKIVAEKMGYSYVDLDRYIEDYCKEDLPTIFLKYGEEYFREVETKCLDELLNKEKVIISTGGGSIIRKANRYRLKERSFVVYLDRELDNIIKEVDFTNRPILKDNHMKLYNLKNEREKLYIDTSDIILKNNYSLDLIVSVCSDVLTIFK